MNELKLFNLLKENIGKLQQIEKISENKYSFNFHDHRCFSVEREADLDNDRWIYYFNSNLSNQYNCKVCYEWLKYELNE